MLRYRFHHQNNINKGVIRELIGAKEIEDKNFETELMVITSENLHLEQQRLQQNIMLNLLMEMTYFSKIR